MIRSQHASNLLESIRFCFAASRLEVEDLCHTLAGEDVVIPRGAFCEFQMRQQSTEIGKANVGIGVTSEDAVQFFVILLMTLPPRRYHNIPRSPYSRMTILRGWRHKRATNLGMPSCHAGHCNGQQMEQISS